MKNIEKNEVAANPSRLDIVIIGSGPAGISAAITATIRNKKVKLFKEKKNALGRETRKTTY